ncbi:hypothetical protein ACVWZX_004491 [Deinococcus sp. UYEF24]
MVTISALFTLLVLDRISPGLRGTHPGPGTGDEKGTYSSGSRLVYPDLSDAARLFLPVGPLPALLVLMLDIAVILFGPRLIGSDFTVDVSYFPAIMDFMVLGMALGGREPTRAGGGQYLPRQFAAGVALHPTGLGVGRRGPMAYGLTPHMGRTQTVAFGLGSGTSTLPVAWSPCPSGCYLFFRSVMSTFISAISLRCAEMIPSASLRTRGSVMCARSLVRMAMEW